MANAKERPNIDEYFMEIARVVSRRSTCHRHNIGAVLVKGKQIISTGYNGAPKGMKDCLELGCLRDQLKIPSGTRHEICRAVHAEQNAILQAAYHGIPTADTVLYTTTKPCIICARTMINAGVKKVIFESDYPDNNGVQFLREAGIIVLDFKKDILSKYLPKADEKA